MTSSSVPKLISWYSGPTLLATIGMNAYSISYVTSVRYVSAINHSAFRPHDLLRKRTESWMRHE